MQKDFQCLLFRKTATGEVQCLTWHGLMPAGQFMIPAT